MLGSISYETVKKPHVLMLVLLISFATVCAVLFTPALPSMATFFDVSESTAQLAVTIYLLGYALGQLPYGPLSNRFGRISALNIGIILQLLGTALCIVSIIGHSFSLMIMGRFVMAVGASVGLMMAFTLLNDFYDKEEARSISSKMIMSFAILPGLSLTVGGLLCDMVSWQSCFYFLFAYGVGMLIIANTFLQEPNIKRIECLNVKNIADNLTKVLKNKSVILYALLMGGCTATIYIYNALSPFIAIEQLHLTESQFGMYSIVPPLGIFFGSMLSQFLNKQFAANKVISIGLGLGAGCAVIMLICFYQTLGILALLLPMMLINCALTSVLSNASVLSSGGAQDKASASSVMNFINMTVGTIGVSLMQLMPQNMVGLLPISIIIVLIFMAGVMLLIKQLKR